LQEKNSDQRELILLDTIWENVVKFLVDLLIDHFYRSGGFPAYKGDFFNQKVYEY